MKGQIPILEMVSVVVILFITFSIFFPQGAFENRWEDANIILKGRDIVLTMDRIGLINNFVSDADALSDFLDDVLPERNLISWTTLDGTIQPRITVACNCTTQQIDNLLNTVSDLRLNEREVQIDFISSTLSPIQQSDVLLIHGYRDLAPFRNEILNYLRGSNGVVILSNEGSPNSAFVEIFGVDECSDTLGVGSCGGAGGTELEFITPSGASQNTFQSYKIFYHLPVRSFTGGAIEQGGFIPTEPGVPSCPDFQPPRGIFSFKNQDISYWICVSSESVYFDSGGAFGADLVVRELDNFVISGNSFKMSYIETNVTVGKIFVSIKPEFRLDDFKPANLRLFPADSDVTKILLKDGNYNSGNPIPVVVVNKSTPGTTIWAPESLVTNTPFRHDERLLLASLILAASNKESRNPFVGEFQIGFLTPYINVVNRDMFEVYQFNLGLGFPF